MKAIFRVALVVAVWLALWPVLASAEPPPPNGVLVYTEDFSDPKKSGLEDKLQAADYSRGFHAPGVYHLIMYNNNDTRLALFPNQAYGTFSTEVDVSDNSDDFAGNVSQGIVFRVQDAAHLYAVLIDSRKGQYAIRKLDGQDSWSDLVAWKPSPLVKQQAEVNELRVDAEGDRFTVYLDGELLDSFSDGAYAQGGFGLIASNVDAVEPHIHFDNVEVYTTETAAAQPGSGRLPNAGEASRVSPPVLLCMALVLLSLGIWVRQRRQRGSV